jgi:hypothetical protein
VSRQQWPFPGIATLVRDREFFPHDNEQYLRAVAAAPYVHSKLAQVNDTDQHNQNIIGIRFWTEEEWLANREAQQGNSRLITNDVSDAVVIDEEEEH